MTPLGHTADYNTTVYQNCFCVGPRYHSCNFVKRFYLVNYILLIGGKHLTLLHTSKPQIIRRNLKSYVEKI